MEWVIMLSLVVAMYIIIYKYEKKMDKLEKEIEKNRSNIEKNENRIDKNHQRLDKHKNHIDKMWITLPKNKDENS